MPAYAQREILAELDAKHANLEWPGFDNMNIDHLSARLSAYRDETRWAVVFNSIQWAQGAIATMIEPIGNCVSVPIRSELKAANEEFYKQFLTDPKMRVVTDTWDKQALEQALQRSKEGNIAYGSKHLHTVTFEYDDDGHPKVGVRGKAIAVSHLKLEPQPALHSDEAFWVAIAVVDGYRDQIFARDDELAAFFPKGAPPRLLVLDDWHHPAGKAPSETETFQLLAKALVAGDASAFRPTEKPNTHWSNWLPK